MPDLQNLKNPNNNPPPDNPPVRVSDKITEAAAVALGFNAGVFRWFKAIWETRGRYGW